ncbi:MAG: hypothetical protein HC893_05200 [Chloroflexaceae bacterium]|nr:hypothetical protein [Chloroflexaceae bacterium]
MVLAYPAELINDTTPPEAGEVHVTITLSQTAVITWTSSEFATTVVRYGTEPGSYPEEMEVTDYEQTHEFEFTDLTGGETVYYTISHTDRSGNTVTLPEGSFVFSASPDETPTPTSTPEPDETPRPRPNPTRHDGDARTRRDAHAHAHAHARTIPDDHTGKRDPFYLPAAGSALRHRFQL